VTLRKQSHYAYAGHNISESMDIADTAYDCHAFLQKLVLTKNAIVIFCQRPITKNMNI
jgi:hypothetical protein